MPKTVLICSQYHRIWELSNPHYWPAQKLVNQRNLSGCTILNSFFNFISMECLNHELDPSQQPCYI